MKHRIYDDPFRAVVVDDFLPAEILQQTLHEIHGHRGTLQQHPAGYKFETYANENLIRWLLKFMKGPQIKDWFEESYKWSDVYRAPQLYRTQGPWKGLAPHTDNQLGRDLAMIIYLNDNWEEQFGGQLQILDETQKVCHRVLPRLNRAAFFKLGPNSWHSVAPIYGSQQRLTLIQDWQRRH